MESTSKIKSKSNRRFFVARATKKAEWKSGFRSLIGPSLNFDANINKLVSSELSLSLYIYGTLTPSHKSGKK